MEKTFFELLKKQSLKNEKKILSPYATCSLHGIRRRYDENASKDHRLPFAIDADRILYSRSYARYIDKTQVFSLVPNDHITHRALHVQFLSKIARTIGSHLRLNLDLIEAISLGHDLGHPPFGHDGEKMLSELSEAHLGYKFFHNIQGVRILELIEKKGKGLNLTIQVLDGVLCHNGEEDYRKTSPQHRETFKDFDTVYNDIFAGSTCNYQPATLEGCLVKICDTISYVGRDLEDAIILKLVKRDDLPQEVVLVLGDTAGKIVYTLVTDVIRESKDKPYIAFSDRVAEGLQKLKRFNYRYIYNNSKIKTEHMKLKKMMHMIFELFVEDLEKHRQNSSIYKDFLEELDEEYLKQTKKERIVIDYIASMTDRYFLDIFKERFLINSLPRYFS